MIQLLSAVEILLAVLKSIETALNIAEHRHK